MSLCCREYKGTYCLPYRAINILLRKPASVQLLVGTLKNLLQPEKLLQPKTTSASTHADTLHCSIKQE